MARRHPQAIPRSSVPRGAGISETAERPGPSQYDEGIAETKLVFMKMTTPMEELIPRMGSHLLHSAWKRLTEASCENTILFENPEPPCGIFYGRTGFSIYDKGWKEDCGHGTGNLKFYSIIYRQRSSAKGLFPRETLYVKHVQDGEIKVRR